MDDAGVDLFQRTVDDAFPARLNVFHAGAGMGPVPGTVAEAARRISTLAQGSTPRLRFGNVKLMLDGTLQGFTAKVRAPGYFRSDSTGMWNISPQEYREAFETFHRAGMTIHVHCNGDDATELFLDTLEAVQIAHPRPDHRHTCTHSQMTTAAQYRRMAALEAVTLGGAYMLKMDHEVGSIEAGKFADLAVLAEDPLAVDPLDIGDIHVLGTMVGGTFHPSNIGSA